METICALIDDALAATETVMQQGMQSDIPLIEEITQHIADGGKRIRPMVVLLIAGTLNYQQKKAIELAATIEFIHTATLLHDDVVDSSGMRRGKPSANALWGNEASVLVGDFLYSRAFQLLVGIGSLELMSILSAASNVMAQGEVLQLMNRHNPEITEETYYQIINAKTAVLFTAACELSATLCGADQETVEAFKAYGHHLGLAFQLIDDALDYSSDLETLGKNVGDDIREGKATLPLIYALHYSDETQQNLIKKVIATGKLDQLDTIQTIIAETNAAKKTMQAAQQHAEKAKIALKNIKCSDHKNALLDLADFVIARSY